MPTNDQPKPNGNENDPQDLWDILNAPTEVEKPAEPKQPAPAPPKEPSPKPGKTEDDSEEPQEPAVRELHPENFIPQESSESAPVSTDASTIQRILSDPSAAEKDDGIDFSQKEEESGDFDSAIRAFHQTDSIAVTCRNHSDRQSVGFCPECEAYYCQECMVVRSGKMLCSACAETLFTPTEEEILSAQEMGLDSPEGQITPDEHPEFQVGGGLFGLEGRPAGFIKRTFALLVDLVITRGMVLVIAAICGFVGDSNPGVFFHLFDKIQGESTLQRVLEAAFLFKPIVPWLIVIATIDFLYFFSMLAFTNRTIGMSWAGCRIVSEWGDFVTFGAVALRTLVFMVFLGFPAIVIAVFFPAFRGPHDQVAGTIVINYSGVKRIDAYESIQIKL